MRNNLSWCLIGGLIGLASAAGTARAELVDINFTVAGKTVTGSGFAEADSSVLASDGNLADLDAFSLTLDNIEGGGPAMTSFSKSDLTGWEVIQESDGSFFDLNFFMRGNTNVNADGDSIEGTGPLFERLCEGTVTSTDGCSVKELDDFTISVTSVTAAAPEPGTMVLLMSGIGAIAFFDRRRLRNN